MIPRTKEKKKGGGGKRFQTCDCATFRNFYNRLFWNYSKHIMNTCFTVVLMITAAPLSSRDTSPKTSRWTETSPTFEVTCPRIIVVVIIIKHISPYGGALMWEFRDIGERRTKNIYREMSLLLMWPVLSWWIWCILSIHNQPHDDTIGNIKHKFLCIIKHKWIHNSGIVILFLYLS